MRNEKLAVIPALLLPLALAACGDANQSADTGEGDDVQSAATCEYPSGGEPAIPVDPPQETDIPNQGTVQATLHLTAGDIDITLDREKAPCAVNSFLSLA